MKIIGITGGVGAGKSEVLRFIKDTYPCQIVLADDVGNKVKEPGEKCYEALVELLGKDVLLQDGSFDRQAMANAIFKDESVLKRVNDIIHPAVIEKIKEMVADAAKTGQYDYYFIEAALLIECGFLDYVDEMWYIYARPEVRRARLKEARGYSDEKIDYIMSSQLSDEEFRSNSDFVIDNSGELEDTYRQIRDKLLG